MNPKQLEEKFIRFAKSATIISVSSLFSGMFRTLEDVDVVDVEKLREVTLSECVARGPWGVCRVRVLHCGGGVLAVVSSRARRGAVQSLAAAARARVSGMPASVD